MTTIIAGGIALAIALGFIGILAFKVPSVPLIIVLLIGFAMMVASLLESVRDEQSGD